MKMSILRVECPIVQILCIKVMKRWLAAIAILFVAAFGALYAIGWLLAKPMQIRVGNAPPELNAQSVSFTSDSGATVHGWWCPSKTAALPFYSYQVSAQIV